MPSHLLLAVLTLTVLTISLLILRLRTILDPARPKPLPHSRRSPTRPTHLLIVLGSGGHTAEMLAMLSRALNESDSTRRLDWRDYTHRTWVVGSGDSISALRAREFEEEAIGLATEDCASEDEAVAAAGTSVVVSVPRAREIHQSLFTAPLSSLRCMFVCAVVLSRNGFFPDLILCNGPATATILVFTSVLLRFFNVGACQTEGKMRTVYVESWARVRKLSLSGRLLERVVDRFLVQWPMLEKGGGGRREFLGVLV